MDQQPFAGEFSNNYIPPPTQETSGNSTQKLSLPVSHREIDLTNIQISDQAWRSLPWEIMQRLRVVPFDIDPEKKTLKVACASPYDNNLAFLLAASAGGFAIEVYDAHPDAIESVLARMSAPSQKEQPAEAASEEPWAYLFETPAPGVGAEQQVAAKENPESGPRVESGPGGRVPLGNVLFVTPGGKISEHLMFSLQTERFSLKLAGSVAAALEFIDREKFDHIFVHDSFRGSADPVAEMIRQNTPWATLRYYASESALLVNDTLDEVTCDLFRKNLRLARHFHDGPNGPLLTHASAVTRLADGLSVRFNLPAHVRPAITTAASLHNLAEAHLTSPDMYGQADIIGLSASRLAALGYPPLVTRLLRQMYQPAAPTATNLSDVELLAGSILSAADFYCHTWPNPSTLSAEHFRLVRESLHSQTNKSVLPAVVSGLLEIIAGDASNRQRPRTPFDVLILVSRGSLPDHFEELLSDSGFSVSLSQSVDECSEACARRRPQALVIRDSGKGEDVYDLILGLALRGVVIDQIPTLLLLDDAAVAEAMWFIRHGIEDVFSADVNVNALVTKLARIRKRLEEKAQSRLAVLQELGTHGSLEDMSLIDLLQAARGNNKAVLISVSAQGRQLTLCVDNGHVLFAECDDATGIDAILLGIGWKRGVWSIDPVSPADIPTPNLNKGIDSVLLEACVKFDSARNI